jgi:hypothetical protein
MLVNGPKSTPQIHHNHRNPVLKQKAYERLKAPLSTELHSEFLHGKAPETEHLRGFAVGAADGTRTHDTWNHNPVL